MSTRVCPCQRRAPPSILIGFRVSSALWLSRSLMAGSGTVHHDTGTSLPGLMIFSEKVSILAGRCFPRTTPGSLDLIDGGFFRVTGIWPAGSSSKIACSSFSQCIGWPQTIDHDQLPGAAVNEQTELLFQCVSIIPPVTLFRLSRLVISLLSAK